MFVASLLTECLKHRLSSNSSNLVPKHELNDSTTYFFDVWWVSLHCLLDLFSKQLRWDDTELLTPFSVDAQQLLRGVIVILHFLLGGHPRSYKYYETQLSLAYHAIISSNLRFDMAGSNSNVYSLSVLTHDCRRVFVTLALSTIR